MTNKDYLFSERKGSLAISGLQMVNAMNDFSEKINLISIFCDIDMYLDKAINLLREYRKILICNIVNRKISVPKEVMA